MAEIVIHVGSDDGRVWCNPPARPRIDKAGDTVRNDRGKPVYDTLITFSTARIRDNWQQQILDALRAKYPDALGAPADKAA